MIALDTNLLVYAHREDSKWFLKADKIITNLAESDQPWFIPWPCIHEFLAIVTHKKIYNPPTPIQDALIQIDYWLESPRLRLLGEGTPEHYWPYARDILNSGGIVGPMVHDARIAALCIQHGISNLYTTDRHFNRMKGLQTFNPLLVES